MDRDTVIAKVREHEQELKRFGVERLDVFGSTARGESRPDSDVDLFFDYNPDVLGLLELIRLKRSASRFLGCPTDIMTRSSIDPYIRRSAEAEAVRVF